MKRMCVRVLVASVFVTIATFGVATKAEAQYVVRGQLGAAPTGCGGVESATLAGISAGKKNRNLEVSVGGITNGCGDHAGQLWPTFGLTIGTNSLNIGHRGYHFAFVANVDVDAYTLHSTFSGETSGEKYLYFRPGFLAEIVVTGFGERYEGKAGQTMSANLFYVGVEAGGFSGHGAYAMLTLTIKGNR